jgi:hypothetical protein
LLEFNHLLRDAEIELSAARLVRHQDDRGKGGRTPYDLWIAANGRFELYQRIQGKAHFHGIDWIIAFVATPLDETLFVGLYENKGVDTAPSGLIDPVTQLDAAGKHFYDLRMSDRLKAYAGRIIIDWGKGYRTWIQRPDRQSKTILELRPSAIEPPFPGFSHFHWAIRQLPSVPHSWRPPFPRSPASTS